MGFNLFKSKNKDKNSEKSKMSDGEKFIVNSLSSAGDDAEKALKIYILIKSRTNDVSIAQKEGATYVNFRGEKIQSFLKDWYNILALRQHDKISEKVYQTFIDAQLAEEIAKPEQVQKQPENKKETDDFDDFFDIFKDYTLD